MTYCVMAPTPRDFKGIIEHHWPSWLPTSVTIEVEDETIVQAPEGLHWMIGRHYRNVLFWLGKQGGVAVATETLAKRGKRWRRRLRKRKQQ